MKIALVHDYIKEYGGAERVLEALTEIFPDAPIYTAFYKEESEAYKRLKNRKIIASWVQNIPFFADKLHSPLRFLAPFIWGSFKEEFKKYDLIISSASWYITKGFGSRCHPELVSGSSPARDTLRSEEMLKLVQHDNCRKPLEICYCHTPPRWLYGYTTSVNFQKYPIVKAYAAIVGHFMRLYDFKSAQKVDYFIANSKETASRIKKFYRRNSSIIYPLVDLPRTTNDQRQKTKDYYFIVSRLVGGKGLEMAIEAAQKAGFKLKIAGAKSGYWNLSEKVKENIEFLGQVSDEELTKLYKGAKAFLALSKDEDFGITPVESMSVGTPVIAYNGGGYKETVLPGKTGLLFDDYSVDGLIQAIKQFNNLTINYKDCIEQAEKFSKERFKKEIKIFVEKCLKHAY
ncbi:MAG: glycosyltransferase [Candidatus Levybacteria bacterium]|nr:glycosyltransferase [Candidatus Levybacteria bacterium]